LLTLLYIYRLRVRCIIVVVGHQASIAMAWQRRAARRMQRD
jgi:hypothetical protein